MIDIHCELARVSDSVFYVTSNCHGVRGGQLVDRSFLRNLMPLCFLAHMRFSSENVRSSAFRRYEFNELIPPEGGTTNPFLSNVPGNAKTGGQFLPRRLVFGSLILKQPEHSNPPGRLQQKNLSRNNVRA